MTIQTPTPARTSTGRKLAYTAAGVLVLLIGIGIGGTNTTPTGPTAADYAAADQFRQMLATPLPVLPAPAAPPVPTGPAASFGDGTFVVGTDIEPGTYKAHPAGQCYWARLYSTTSESDITANHLASGPATVTISAGDKAFMSGDCGTWVKVG